MPDVSLVPPAFALTLRRGTDTRLRAVVIEDGLPVDLTGDVLTMTVKDAPGGTQILTRDLTLEPQTGVTLGQATIMLAATELVSTPPSPITPVNWVFEIRRLHTALVTVPIAGTIALAPSI